MELEWLAYLEASLPKRGPGVELGVGDDAAVLSGDRKAAAADMILDGAHFQLAECGPRLAGRKAVAVNFSDLAAMGAWPEAVFLSLALPRRDAASVAAGVLQGANEICQEFDALIAGGDTNVWDGPLAISVTVVGRLNHAPWLRSGARPGDCLLTTGPLGGSLLGRHLTFSPRLRLARALQATGAVHAAIDISDGLALDLSRMMRASGCGGALQVAAVPLHEDARRRNSSGSGVSPLRHALTDGEDFELLLAVPPEKVDAVRQAVQELRRQVGDAEAGEVHEIGRCLEGDALQIEDELLLRPLPPQGYQHGQPADRGAMSLAAQCDNVQQTAKLARWLATALPASAVVSLQGDLGAGKTCLVRAFAEASGVPAEQVTSPTFMLCQTYQGQRRIHHLDAYRIADDDEFRDLGVEELFDDEAVTMVEWGGRVQRCLPPDRLDLTVEILDRDRRCFRLEERGRLRLRLEG